MNRRRFLTVSLGSAVALSGLYGVTRLWTQASGLPPELAAGLRCLSPKQARTLQAAALRILQGAEPDPAQDGAQAQIRFIDQYLSRLATPLQDDVRALLELLEYAPLPRFGSRFSRLAAADQDRLLQGWETSRIDLLRQGLFALKSLCCLSHYQDERSFAAIGYSGPMVGRGQAG